MTLRTKFFIIVGVVIAFIIFVIMTLSRGSEDIVLSQPSITNTAPALKANVQHPQPNPPAGGVGTVQAPITTPSPDLLDISRSFAERFGSFSNQSNFENVEGLKPFMTPAMRKWADTFVRDAAAKADPGAPYYGITTRTLEVVAKNVQEASATVV